MKPINYCHLVYGYPKRDRVAQRLYSAQYLHFYGGIINPKLIYIVTER